jgi:hypothetical protein
LDRRVRRADVWPEAPHSAIQVLDDKRETPEARRCVASTVLIYDGTRLLDDLEDLAPEPEESLARRPGRRWLLADSAQRQPGRPKSSHAAIERRRHRDDVIDSNDAVGVRGRDDGHWRLRAGCR